MSFLVSGFSHLVAEICLRQRASDRSSSIDFAEGCSDSENFKVATDRFHDGKNTHKEACDEVHVKEGGGSTNGEPRTFDLPRCKGVQGGSNEPLAE